MKLQYLGDYRDAFKWDLLHWLCTTSYEDPSPLHFVPLLTPDDLIPRDGQIPHHRFAARSEAQRFLANLKDTPRGLEAITDLGTLTPTRPFTVKVHAPTRYLLPGSRRREYWHDIEYPQRGVIFLDPDNGFETRTRKGPKWVRHHEVKELLTELPPSSVAVVYQHRPHRTWDEVLNALAGDLRYAGHVTATYDSSLAFIIIGRVRQAAQRFSEAAMLYSARHESVKHRLLIGGA